MRIQTSWNDADTWRNLHIPQPLHCVVENDAFLLDAQAPGGGVAAQVVQGVGLLRSKSRWGEAAGVWLFDGEGVVVAGGVDVHEYRPGVRQVLAYRVQDVEAVGVHVSPDSAPSSPTVGRVDAMLKSMYL